MARAGGGRATGAAAARPRRAVAAGAVAAVGLVAAAGTLATSGAAALRLSPAAPGRPLRPPPRALTRGRPAQVRRRLLARAAAGKGDDAPEAAGAEAAGAEEGAPAVAAGGFEAEDAEWQRREVLSLAARTAVFGFYAACFLPEGRRTDAYRWACAQLEALDADAQPGQADAAVLARAIAAASKTGPCARVLDLGAGTGGDLNFLADAPLPRPFEVVAVDPNTFVWERAGEQARTAGLAVGPADGTGIGSVSFVADVSAVPSGSVSLALCHRVLCSVEDPTAVLKEVYRTLRPGGVLAFVEHVAAREGSLLRPFQYLWKPVQQAFANNCDPARDTLVTLRQACPWASVEAEPYILEGGGPIAPHVRGFAVKPSA